MVHSRIGDLIDAPMGRLDRRVFHDTGIYQRELERVFGRVWLFLGHSSLILSPNDFCLTYMGEDPVILCRTAQGEVKAFLNMCRHRGNRIVRADDGNAKNFMCAYHGWTFSNEGKLVSVPGLQEAYYGELDVDSLGLVQVAQLAAYRDMIFATWASDAPALTEYLGDMAWYLDIWLDRREGGVRLLGPEKWMGQFNWKIAADNFIGDMYHAPFSHASATKVLMDGGMRFGPLPPPETKPPGPYEMRGFQFSPGNGHGLGCLFLDPEQGHDLVNSTPSDQQAYHERHLGEFVQRLGQTRTRLMPGHATVFPNLSFLGVQTSMLHVWHPRGPGRTEIWTWSMVDRDAEPEDGEAMRRFGLRTFGPAGIFEQDDMDNWRQSTEAGRSPVARRSPSLVNMGIGRETTNSAYPGRHGGNLFSEINQRDFYRWWAEVMDAADWSELSHHLGSR